MITKMMIIIINENKEKTILDLNEIILWSVKPSYQCVIYSFHTVH